MGTNVCSSVFHDRPEVEQPKPKGPSTGEQVNEMWTAHTMEYCPAIRRPELLTHDSICMKRLEWTQLWRQKVDRCWPMASRGWGAGEKWGELLKGLGFPAEVRQMSQIELVMTIHL